MPLEIAAALVGAPATAPTWLPTTITTGTAPVPASLAAPAAAQTTGGVAGIPVEASPTIPPTTTSTSAGAPATAPATKEQPWRVVPAPKGTNLMITRREGKPQRVPVAKLVTLYGVEGFALHRSTLGALHLVGTRLVHPEWSVSHVATGCTAGSGRTQEEALRAAESHITASARKTGKAPRVVLQETIDLAKRTAPVPTLALDLLRRDGGTQPRAGIDRDIVQEYANAMKGGAKFPPLVAYYDGTNYWLVDGFHRGDAYKEVGITDVECEVHLGTLEDARWYSFSANRTHGLRRTNEDKQRAVKAALAHSKAAGLSDEQIAEHLGVHRNTVLAYRKEATCTNCASQPAHRTGRDGRAINTTKIGESARRAAQAKRRSPVTPKREATAAPTATPAKLAVAIPAEGPQQEPAVVSTVTVCEESSEQTTTVIAAVSEEKAPEATIPVVVATPVEDSSQKPKTQEAAQEGLRVPLPAAHLRGEPPTSIAPTVEAS